MDGKESLEEEKEGEEKKSAESPEAEEESAEEPAESSSSLVIDEAPPPKPAASAALDVTGVVAERLQQLVTLPRLQTALWSEDAQSALRRFVEDRSEETLTIVLESRGEQLVASPGPPHATAAFSVFIRLSPEPLKADKLHKQVGHFSVPGHAGEASLVVLESGFAQPFVFSNNSWPLSAKTRLCGLLHEFFSELGRLQHAGRGLTLLYVPREGLADAADSTVMLGRLEEAIARWFEQVSTAVSAEQLDTKLPLVTDIINFWNNKYENMCFLEAQLSGEAVRHFLPVLDDAESDGARQLRFIIAEAARGRSEAESNTRFLSALNEPCQNLAQCCDLAEISPHFIRLLNVVRLVWLKAPHFNSRSRVLQLFSCLSHQVIEVCSRTVNLRSIFRGRPLYGTERASACITCCQEYMQVYEEIAELHRKHTEHDWDLNSQEIFSSIYTFINRCKELKEICEAMMIFGRVNEREVVAKPLFAGPNGRHFEAECESIMRDILRDVGVLATKQSLVLDVTCGTWREDMDRFRQQVTQVERRVEALAHVALEGAATVDEGLHAMKALNHFLQKPSLRQLFEQKSNLVYGLLTSRIEAVSKAMLGGEPVGYTNLPPYAGAALMAQHNKTHLQRQMTLLENARRAGLVTACEEREKVAGQLAFLVEVIDATMQEYFDQWVGALPGDWEARLRRPLLTPSPSRVGMIEPTLSRDILEAMSECRMWESLGFKPPSHMQELGRRERTIVELRENMLAVSKTYNEAIASLSDAERCLFKDFILKIDKNLNPAFTHYSWTSTVPVDFTTKSIKNVENLTSVTRKFHASCEAILAACSKIGESSLLEVRPGCLYEAGDMRDKLRNAIKPQYEKVLELLLNIKNNLGTITPNTLPHWTKFIVTITNLADEAVILLVRDGLAHFLDALTGSPNVLVHVTASVKDNKISFDPPITEISKTVYETLECIKYLTRSIPNITLLLKLKSTRKLQSISDKIAKDPKCKELQKFLNAEIDGCMQQLTEYIEGWEAFSWVWTLEREHFIASYQSQKPFAAAVSQDIDRISAILEEANISKVCRISFIEVDATAVNDTIVQHIQSWQGGLVNLMLESTLAKVQKFSTDLESDMKKLLRQPSTLQDVAEKTMFCHISMGQIPSKELQLQIIMEHNELLAHYKVQIPENLQEYIDTVQTKWKEYLASVEKSRSTLETSKDTFRSGLMDSGNALNRELNKVCFEVHKNGPFQPTWEEADAFEFLENTRTNLNSIKTRKEDLCRDFDMFGLDPPQLPELKDIEKVLTILSSVWDARKSWISCWSKYKKCKFSNLETNELQSQVNLLSRKLTRLAHEPARDWPVLEQTRAEVENLKHALPLIQLLRSPALRPRHWQQVQQALHRSFDPKSDDFTLKEAMTMGITNFEEDIKTISRDANMENKIEMGLNDIAESWSLITLKFEPKTESKIFQIRPVNNICSLVDQHLGEISAMEASKYVAPFFQDVKFWKKRLCCLLESLDTITAIQRQLLEIEPILLDETMNPELSTSTIKEVFKDWRKMLYLHKSEQNILQVVCAEGYSEKIKLLICKLEKAECDLQQFLEIKREACPRLCLLSTHEQLRLFQSAPDHNAAQKYMRKCFPGISSLRLGRLPNEVLGFCSASGELLTFTEPVFINGPVDEKIAILEQAMQNALQTQVSRGYESLQRNPVKRERWMRVFAGQVCILASKLWWTSECTRALQECVKNDRRKPIKLLRQDQELQVAKLCDAIKGKLTYLDRLKTAALLTCEIHALNVIDKLYDIGCKDPLSYDWLTQLRYYRDQEQNTVDCRQMFGVFNFNFEYYGDSIQPIITPQSDRCSLFITTLLYLRMAGFVSGPQGSGKTETLRGLAISLGRMLLVVNCSQGINVKGFENIVAGAARLGGWLVLHEFLSTPPRVLGVAAQLVRDLAIAVASGKEELTVRGGDVRLHPDTALFVTLTTDASGQSDRSLPASLRALMRPVAVGPVDMCLVVEMTLLREGVQDANTFAHKVCRLYELCRLHMSQQSHYDFGNRKLVHLATAAGENKRSFASMTDEEVILYTLTAELEPQLVPADRLILLQYTSDLFPGVEAPATDHKDLAAAISSALQGDGLMPLGCCVKKSLEIFEALTVRDCVVLVGKSGSGKSTAWKALSQALSSLQIPGFEQVEVHTIYLNALSYAELYGEFDETTEQFQRGIISDMIRKICAEESNKSDWILLDGKVSETWIDTLFGIMDDSRVLTVGNGERINIQSKIKLIFEVENLATASPSLASYCGCVYFDYDELGIQPFVDSWVKTLDKGPIRNEITRLLSANLEISLKFKDENCTELVPQSHLSCAQTLCRMLKAFLGTAQNEPSQSKNEHDPMILINHWFFFCLLWSLFGAIEIDSYDQVDVFLQDLEGSAFPTTDLVFDYIVDPFWGGFVKWHEKFSMKYKYDPSVPFHKTVVPTIDFVRYGILMSALVKSGYPVMLTGNIGTGKTLLAQMVLKDLNREKFSTITINGTSQRTKSSLIDMIGRKLEKRFGRVLVPARDKTLVVFVDDVGLAPRDESGCQPALEMLRQWLERGFWFDSRNQATTVKGLQLLTTLRHRGPSNLVSARLQRHFSVLNLSDPADGELAKVFGATLSQHLLGFGEQIKLLGKSLINSSIDVFNAVRKNLLPTPTNCHYIFSLRNLATVFQGLLLSNRDYHNTRSAMCKLWIHENCRAYCDRVANSKDKEWFVKEISHQVSRHFKFQMHNLCPGNKLPLFANFSSKEEESLGYVELSTEDAQEKLESILEATSPGTDVVVSRDVAEHVARLVRVLSQPASHLLLLGTAGCGRRTLVRLACRLCKVELVCADIGSDPEDQLIAFKEQVRVLVRQTGVRGQPTAFLVSDSQIVQEKFLDIINNIIKSGQIHDLFDESEIEEMNGELKETGKDSYFDPEEANTFITDRVQHNLHIVLSFDPNAPRFRERLCEFPAISCCTMDFFFEWPKDALLKVAKKNVNNLDLGDTEHDLKGKLAEVFAQFHQSIVQTVEKLDLRLSITPVHYLDCVTGYTLLLASKQKELRSKIGKLKEGLKKIEETRQRVELMSEDLLQAQRKVLERQRQCEVALVTLGQRRREVEEQGEVLAGRAKQLAQEEAATQQLARLAHAAMDEAVPFLEDADMALDSLSHKELLEMRAYGRPPAAVELVMSAVLILRQADPTWVEAKRQLADTNFIDQLQGFDKDHIPEKTLKAVATFTCNPEFNPEKVETVSVPAKYLALWVIAIEKYGKIYRVAAPKRAKLDRASRELREHQAELADLQTKLAHLKAQLVEQKKEYESRLQIRDLLNAEAEEKGTRLNRANQLVSGLASEEEKWRSSVQLSGAHEQLLLGDCLVVAALLSYAGPFSEPHRRLLQEALSRHVQHAGIQFTAELRVSDLLVDQATLMEWRLLGLSADPFSPDSAVTALQHLLVASPQPPPFSRWPLLVDPQGLALKWMHAMIEFKELKITDQRTKDFTAIIEEAIENGYPLVIEKFEGNLNPVLVPLLLRNITNNENGESFITFNGKIIPYNPEFKLFFTTQHQNVTYGPEVSSRINVINFNIQQTGLEEILLCIMGQKEKPGLEDERKYLSQNILSGCRKLTSLEDDILRILIETEGSLLDNEAVMDSLETNKSANVAASEKLASYEETQSEIDAQRESYLPSANRAATLFAILLELQKVEPMYQFSVDAYLEQFSDNVENSLASQSTEERITAINELHTLNFYRKTSHALFEHHKLPFFILICSMLLEEGKRFPLTQLEFLVKKIVVKHKEKMQIDNPCSAWLSDTSWKNISILEKFDSKFEGIGNNLIENAKEWTDWCINSQPENVPLIGGLDSLASLDRVLVVASLRPDRLVRCLHGVVCEQLGPETCVPGELEVGAMLEGRGRPVLLLPGPRVELHAGLEQLAAAAGSSGRLHVICLGQAQTRRATTLLEGASNSGEWVFLNDCHLSIEWLAELEQILEKLELKETHNNFRVWMSSQRHEKFPIGIAKAADKITVERPMGLRPNMQRLLPQVSTEGSEIPGQLDPLWHFGLLHCILIERQHFKHIGWSCSYDFSDNDFLVCSKLLTVAPRPISDTSLRLLVADVSYGGRVFSPWDQRLLAVLSEHVLVEQALTTPSTIVRLDIPTESTSSVDDKDALSALPSTLHPESYGLFSNAAVPIHQAESEALQLSLRQLFVAETTKIDISTEDIGLVLNTCNKILAILQKTSENERKINFNTGKPMELVLSSEMAHYNKLIIQIQSDIKELQSALQGFVPWSRNFNLMFKFIANGEVPLQWLRGAGRDPLMTWILTLEEKIASVREWATQPQPPKPINLAALNSPLAFLSALFQMKSTHLIELDNMTWTFTIAKKDESLEQPLNLQDGCILQGISLEGASWETESGYLTEPSLTEPSCKMPDILIRPTHLPNNTYYEEMYNCPCYTDFQRSQYLFSIPLNPGLSPSQHWVLKSVALIMTFKKT